MTLDIEHAFPVVKICICCDKRPVREGGIINCQVCADMITAKRMDRIKIKMAETAEMEITVDECEPDVADYIEHNTSMNGSHTLTENDRLIMSMKDYGQWDDLDVPDQAWHGPENNGSLRD